MIFLSDLSKQPAEKGLTSWLSFVVLNCEFVTAIGILDQVWYLIVSIPDLCTLTYFNILDFAGRHGADQARVSEAIW